jgi:two-component system nitrogen regulation sensor histidine kinase NtrY
MKGLGFRGRLFGFLLLFALVPSILLLYAWGATTNSLLPLVGATGAWDSVSSTGHKAVLAARREVKHASTRDALDRFDGLLREGALHAQQTEFLVSRSKVLGGIIVGVLIVILALLASQTAAHLSRNMSRPLQELVDWTDLIARGATLPKGPPPKGSPEFAVLRQGMHRMSNELAAAQQRALDAERAEALRESARQVAHELKNPLTPIRFAVARLRSHMTPETRDAIEVLDIESARLDAMARSFAQFGKLPEGPRTAVDLGELARYAARTSGASAIPIEVDIAPDTPMIEGHFDALSRAVSNVVLNALDACDETGRIRLRVSPTDLNGRAAAEIVVDDTGHGISADRLPHVFDPYVTTKPGGTGLGLAIVRQTVLAHDGEVAASSVPGKGTSIRLVLPVASPEPV